MNISKESVLSALDNHIFNIHVFDRVDSTNSLLKQMADLGAENGTVVISKSQSKGRGRLGRTFFSPENSGVYMSVLVRQNMPASKALQLTTATAVAVMLALKKHADAIKIKWVNDIYLNDKKVCGILTESAFSANGMLDYAVIGIGINLYPPEGGFPEDIVNRAGSLFNSKNELSCTIVADVLNSLNSVLFQPTDIDIVNLYRSNSWLDGKRVLVSSGDKSFYATVNGVDSRLRLSVTTDNGRTHSLFTGDVSITAQEGTV